MEWWGCTLQFWSWYVFELMLHLHQTENLSSGIITRHSTTKGSMDGVGGLKTQVYKNVQPRNIIISNSVEFFLNAHKNNIVTKIISMYLPSTYIMEEPEEIATATAIPGTLEAQQMKEKLVPKADIIWNSSKCLKIKYHILPYTITNPMIPSSMGIYMPLVKELCYK